MRVVLHSKMSSGHNHCYGYRGADSMRIVLMVLDQSEEAAVTFEYYLDHVHQCDYKILLLLMTDTSRVLSNGGCAVRGDESYEMTEDSHSRIKIIETRYTQRLRDQKVPCRVRTVAVDEAAAAIIEEARTENVAMVTIGTRGVVSSGNGFGPLPDYVISHTCCPVVIMDTTSRESTI